MPYHDSATTNMIKEFIGELVDLRATKESTSGCRERWAKAAVAATGGHRPRSHRNCIGVVLGTLGFFLASFGQATECTDFNEALHACDGLYRWLAVGFVGQWVLAVVSALALVVGLRRPQRRRSASLTAWVTVGLAIGWYSFYFLGAYHAFKVHS